MNAARALRRWPVPAVAIAISVLPGSATTGAQSLAPETTSGHPSDEPPVIHERLPVEDDDAVLLRIRDAATGVVVGETLELPSPAPEAPSPQPAPTTASPTPSPSPAPSWPAPDGSTAAPPGEGELPTPDTALPDAYYDGDGDGFVDYVTAEGLCARTDVGTARYYEGMRDSIDCAP